VNFSNLELVLGTALSCIGLYFAYRRLMLKVGGMKVRGGYTQCLRIPVQISHPFHCKPATDSIASQPPIPVESGR